MAEKIPSEDKRFTKDEERSLESDSEDDLKRKTDDRTEAKSAIKVEKSNESDKGEEFSSSKTDLSDRTESKSASEDKINNENVEGEDLRSKTGLCGRVDKSTLEEEDRSSESDMGEGLNSRVESEGCNETDSEMPKEATYAVSDSQEESHMSDELTDRLELSSSGNSKDELKEERRRTLSSQDEVNDNTNFQKLDRDRYSVMSYRLTRNPLMIPAFILSNVRDALERARTWGQTLVPIYSTFVASFDIFMNYFICEVARHNRLLQWMRPVGSRIQTNRDQPDRVLVYKNEPINVPEALWATIESYQSILAIAVTEYITDNEDLYNEINLEVEAMNYIRTNCNMQ